MAKPEKLNLFDRFFNRYRKEFYQRGEENWHYHNEWGQNVPNSNYQRNWIEYKVIDRLTGSEAIKRQYIN